MTPWHLEELEKQAAEESRDVALGDFVVTPAEHHPFYRVIATNGEKLPHALLGVFTTKQDAIRAVKLHIGGLK